MSFHYLAADMLESMNREQLIDLTTLYARAMITVDGLWFLEVEKSLGIDEAIQLDENVWRIFGQLAIKRLKKFLGIETVSSLEGLARLIMLSPMFVCLGGTACIDNGKCIASVTHCHPQKMRVQKGMGEFPCKSVGKSYFEGMVAEMGPKVRFNCRFCPPDEHPENLWCQWEIWLKQTL